MRDTISVMICDRCGEETRLPKVMEKCSEDDRPPVYNIKWSGSVQCGGAALTHFPDLCVECQLSFAEWVRNGEPD